VFIAFLVLTPIFYLRIIIITKEMVVTIVTFKNKAVFKTRKGHAMLHDLYLLSCYFEPSQAMLFEDELEDRYGQAAVREALMKGWIEIFCSPLLSSASSKPLCRLSKAGIGKVENHEIALNV